jgi:tRNA (guanine37-N1)-methyltransferase
MFRGFVDGSILRRGQETGTVSIQTKNIRDFSQNSHKKVDDVLFGGGAGMLLKPGPVSGAIRSAKAEYPGARVVYLSPGGDIFTQKKAEYFAEQQQDLILLCGRYEGVDQRIRATLVDEELSVGEYVLSGGEIAAAVVVDAVARLIPGVVGKRSSVEVESFSPHIFRCVEFPQFTRPKVWEGLPVPEVLYSGNHAEIESWQFSHLSGLSDAERRVLNVRRNVFPKKTKRFLLRNHERGDIDHWMKWMNDEEVSRYISLSPPFSREDEEEYFETSQENLSLLPISICDKKTKKPIGNASITIDPFHEDIASFGIIIGEKNYWGRGVCQEVVAEMLRMSFQELGLVRVYLDVFTENIAAQKCYEKVGMRRSGYQEKKYMKSGGFFDAYFYEMLKEDFKQL